jgi:hypothetical protein
VSAFFSLLFVIAAGHPPDPTPVADTRAVLDAVIAHEADGHGASRARIRCFRPRLAAATLGVIRDVNATGPSELPMLIPSLDWQEVSRGAIGAPVPEAKRQALNAAVRSIVTGPRAYAAAERIDRSRLANSLRFCSGRPAANSSGLVIELRSPSFGEGFAFVGISIECGLLCGAGLLYALERRGAAWQIVAVAGEWAG